MSTVKFVFLIAVIGSFAHAESVSQSSALMGKRLSVIQNSGLSLSNRGITSDTQVQFLGNQRSLMEASVELGDDDSVAPAAGPAPITKTDLYIGGVRVWNGSLRLEKGGIVYSGGVAPTQIPIPLVVYPLGPLILQVDAGLEFEGLAEASIFPGLSIPIEDMTLDASLKAELFAAGYVEGYAKLLFVRGGLGGRVNFIEGSTGLSATLSFNDRIPQTHAFGRVSLLGGQVYAFVDSKFLFGRWTRWYSKNLFRYPGKCFSFGEASCVFQ